MRRLMKFFLYKHIGAWGRVLYVGITNDIARRTKEHLRTSKHRKLIKKVLYCELKNETEMKFYEVYLINKHNPKYNKKDKRGDDVSFLRLKRLKFKKWR